MKNIFSLPPTLSRSRIFNNVCDFNLICANVINFFFTSNPCYRTSAMIFLPFTLGRKEIHVHVRKFMDEEKKRKGLIKKLNFPSSYFLRCQKPYAISTLYVHIIEFSHVCLSMCTIFFSPAPRSFVFLFIFNFTHSICTV